MPCNRLLLFGWAMVAVGCGDVGVEEVGMGQEVTTSAAANSSPLTCIQQSWTITSVTGAARVIRQGGGAVPGVVGTVIGQGDGLSVAAGGRVELISRDGFISRVAGPAVQQFGNACPCAYVVVSHPMNAPIDIDPPAGCFITGIEAVGGSYTFQAGAQPFQGCGSTSPVNVPWWDTGCNGDLAIGIMADGSYFCDFDRDAYQDNEGTCTFRLSVRPTTSSTKQR